MIQWPLALGLAGVVVALSVWRARMALDKRRDVGVAIAHTDRLKQLLRFQTLLRRQRRTLVVELCGVGLAIFGVVILIARPTAVSTHSRQMRSRDVMLCLDVSGSMSRADAVVVRSYLDLVARLHGERIGLVVWDASSALAFPLTDDYPFITSQLRSLITALSTAESPQGAKGQAAALLAAARVGNASSLIGDGLTSCLLRFDDRAQDRPRTVVFATDNQLAGAPLFTLDEAGNRAVREHVLVMGISPGGPDDAQKEELRRVVAATGGKLLDVADGDAQIVAGIERRQRAEIRNAPGARSYDVVWPGATLLAAGLIVLLVASARRTR